MFEKNLAEEIKNFLNTPSRKIMVRPMACFACCISNRDGSRRHVAIKLFKDCSWLTCAD